MADEVKAIEQIAKCDGKCWLWDRGIVSSPELGTLNESQITNSYSKSVLLEVQGV